MTVLEELSFLRASVVLGAAPESRQFEFSRGGREGGCDTPPLFNMMLEHALEAVARGWHSRSRPLGGQHVLVCGVAAGP